MLAGCGGGAPKEALPPGTPRIACAVNGAPLKTACGMEERKGSAGRLIVIRHPDGGFRRLQLVTDGRGVVAADGALPARVRMISPKLIEVTVDGDVYHLPATPMGKPPAS
jgi:hypothetical protein